MFHKHCTSVFPLNHHIPLPHLPNLYSVLVKLIFLYCHCFDYANIIHSYTVYYIMILFPLLYDLK